MKILLAIDDSDGSAAATKAVISQFTPNHTHVHVLYADEWPKGPPPSISGAEGSAASDRVRGLHELRRHGAASLVALTGEQLRGAGFSTTMSVRDGDASQAILDCASEWHADLVVLGSHGRKGFDRLSGGSVSDSVARNAPCSVEVVRLPANAD